MTVTCDAVLADFAWFTQTCMEPAVGAVTVDGHTFHACQTHMTEVTP